MVILDPYGMTFDAVGVFGLVSQLSFKSCSSYCGVNHLSEMAIFSLKWCFHFEKLMTLERENESKKKKEPQILDHNIPDEANGCFIIAN